METNTSFQTQQMRVMIDDMSQAGSAFGSAENGEVVFLNQRLVERMSLEIGDIFEAYVIPNYVDKRKEVPWRAVKVVRDAGKPDEYQAIVPAEPARTASQLDEEILNLLRASPTGLWSTAELAKESESEVQTAGNSCTRLFNAGRIATAEVYGAPNQSRSSFRLWGNTLESFR